MNITSLINLDQEALINKMIHVYCSNNHNTGNGLCNDCNTLYLYASERLQKCPYVNRKPVCANCRIHCYKKDYREQIRIVMKFSGPRIMLYKPIIGIKYLLKKKFFDRNIIERNHRKN